MQVRKKNGVIHNVVLTLMYNCETFINFYVSRTRELSLAATLAKNIEISTMRL